MPFLSEEIWQQLPKPAGTPGSIMITLYPTVAGQLIDEEAEATIGVVQGTVVAVRNLRAELNLGPGLPLDVTLIVSSPEWRRRLEGETGLLTGLGRLGAITLQGGGEAPHGTLVDVVHQGGVDVTVCVHLAGQIDVAVETQRIERELAKAQKERAQVAGKLGNESFLARAPEEVVEKERRRLAECDERLAKLGVSRERLALL